MNLYRRFRDSKIWYTPIYYVVMGIVVGNVWSASGDDWGIPHLIWQAGCVLVVSVAVLDSARLLNTGTPEPKSNV